MSDCIFCKIISGEIPSPKLHEDEICVAFKDIHPKAPIHLLIVPKEHIAMVSDLEEGKHDHLVGHMVNVANKLAKQEGAEGYQLQFNVGEKGGQEVMHVHMHLMGWN
jgi:histidine triad (HIT) family protein